MKNRKQYVSAMLYAIKRARKDTLTGKQTTSTNALRAIQRFERIKGTAFDPFCPWQLRVIEGKGVHEGFTQRAKRLKISTKTQPFEVSIPTADGKAIAELVEIQIPMEWDAELEEWLMTEEGLKQVEDTKGHFQELKLRGQVI